jgi:uncharacterized protein involved in type VI secretion and phage assembly
LKLAPHPAPTSALKFTGRDAVSELYLYDIEFTSPVAGIPMDQVVGRPAKFIIAPVDPGIDYRAGTTMRTSRSGKNRRIGRGNGRSRSTRRTSPSRAAPGRSPIRRSRG